MRVQRGALPALTGLRFIAAAHVVVYHLAQERTTGVLRAVVSAGYLGVSLFFVLSGFVLAYTYADRKVDYREYLVARLARIYPMYALALLVAAPFYVRAPVGPVEFALCAPTTVLMVQSWFPPCATSWNGPGWSLAVEWFFYLLLPLLLPSWLWPRTARSAGVAIAGLTLAGALAPSLYLWAAPDGLWGADSQDTGFWLDLVRYAPLFHLPEFLIGLLFGRLFLSNPQSGPGWALVGATVAMLILLVFVVSPSLPYLVLHNGALAPLFGLLVYALATGHGFLARVLSTSPLQTLGEASYSLYLLHIPLALGLQAVWPHLVGATGVGYILAYAAAALLVPVVTHAAFENPMRRWIRQRWDARAVRAA